MLEWTPAALQGLRRLPNLKRLAVALHLPLLEAAAPIQYPPLLHFVDLQLGCFKSQETHMYNGASTLHGLQSCASLTRLKLSLVSQFSINLSLLGQLQQLRHLAIDGFVERHYTPVTAEAIKSLPRLETLELRHSADEAWNANQHFENDWLPPFLWVPHQLQQLQYLLYDDALVCDLAFGNLLSSLRSLHHLQLPYTSHLVLPLLVSFLALQSLLLCVHADLEQEEEPGPIAAAVVHVFDHHGHARLSAIVPHLTHCSLTELDLGKVACDEQAVAALCESQPLLRSLFLADAALTPSSLLPLSTLRELQLFGLDLTSHSDGLPQLFEQIVQCKTLQHLALKEIAPALSESQQQQLQPPSALLPQLTSFVYTSRED